MSIESEIADALRHRRPETYGPGLRQEQNSSEESMQIASAGLKRSKFEFVAAMIAAMTIPAHASTIPGWQCPRRSHRQRKHQYQHGLDSRFHKHSSYGSERGSFHFYVMAGKPGQLHRASGM